MQTLQTACRCPGDREVRPSPGCSKDRQAPGWSVTAGASPVRLQPPPRDCDGRPLTWGEPAGGSDVVYPEDATLSVCHCSAELLEGSPIKGADRCPSPSG